MIWLDRQLRGVNNHSAKFRNGTAGNIVLKRNNVNNTTGTCVFPGVAPLQPKSRIPYGPGEIESVGKNSPGS